MKDLKPVRGKFYISRLIAEGEHETQDFKFQISDALKIARSLSAFANNRGGRLLIGVKDNGSIAGVRSEEDIYVIDQAAQLYCRPPLDVRFTAFSANDEGAVVIRAEVSPSEQRPVQAREPDGRWRAYFRVADENIVASPLMVRSWRRAMDDSGQLLGLDGPAKTLLAIIERDGCTDARTLMKEAHISLESAEETIVSLAASRLVGFRHTGGAFRVTAAPQSESKDTPDMDAASHRKGR